MDFKHDIPVEQPLGRIMSILGKGYLQLLRAKLQHLDIDRNFYALVLIESGEGTITQQELALFLDTDKVSIVRIVDYLSDKGYVERIRNSGDRRKHYLVLSMKAKQALPEIRKAITDVNKMVLEGLDNSRISGFREDLELIKVNITANSNNA
jgi:MarR family transcriptional regulator, transcriptional regulator for hemolysin